MYVCVYVYIYVYIKYIKTWPICFISLIYIYIYIYILHNLYKKCKKSQRLQYITKRTSRGKKKHALKKKEQKKIFVNIII